MKKRALIFSLLAIFFLSGLYASSVTRYVSLSGSNTAPYTSLATAANSIQDAVDASSDGDLVLVNDGTYLLSTNISVLKGITIKSINGAAVTIIDGNNSTRCIYINHANAVLEEFTIQNGYNPGGFGGGANIKNGGTIRKSTIKNSQARDGGGVAIDDDGLVENCYIYGNTASNNSSSGYGGGVRLLNGGEIRNCEITANTSVKYGGGVNIWNAGIVKNCVIAKNSALHGGGIRTRNNSKVYNTIIYYNSAPSGNDYQVSGSGYKYYNSCFPGSLPPSSWAPNCINSAPKFVNINPGSEDYRLQSSSPCIDVGMNFGWMTTVPDLDGNARIYNTICDMGAYEYGASGGGGGSDSDGDGIADVDDDYPSDADRAFDNYFPAGGKGTLAFEDLWPGKGDYDFNDLVLDYRFHTVTNGTNHVVEIFGKFVIKATGASFANGFGFQLPNNNIAPHDIRVTGQVVDNWQIVTNAYGLEQGQVLPTVIVYDNSFDIMPHPGYGLGVNTDPDAPYVEPDSVEIYMSFTQNVYTMAQVDIENFNPFIYTNQARAMEVHLPDLAPTSLVDTYFFGILDDDTDPSINRYYKTENNLPWAINIPEPFDYPKEKALITSAHLMFYIWAESEGTLSQDWYQDLPGYRNDAFIYTHE